MHRKKIIARHAHNRQTSTENPGLTLLGIWQALTMGMFARRAGLRNVTFLSSTARRCKQTGRIVQLFFPETWFQSNRFRESELLYVSARDGHSISDARYADIETLVADCPGDTFVSTHSQVLTKTREQLEINSVRYKVNPGGAYLQTGGTTTLLCGIERTLEATL